ncbi:MAG: hypothetical protein HOH16_13000 [Planctomycetaceae bacterium]|nr:hypothetical protein [Planctomycetaceae bacterium]
MQISRFLGEASDPLTPLQESDLSGATHSFEMPVLSRDLDYKYFRQLIESLVHQCIRPLAVTNRGASSLQVRLGTNGVRGSTILEVGLYKPTAKTSHLVDLVMLRFERTHLPREITGVSVEVLSADALPCRQQTLFRSPVQSDMSQFEILLNRLTSRLGSGAVVEPQLLSDIQPEASWVAAPVVHVMGTSGSCRSGHAHESKKTQVSKSVVGPSRPIFLLSRPQLLEVSSLGVHGVPVRFSWKGRVHVVMRTRGPERIETAWWRGPTVRRDYYICETNLGGRFWIFRGLQKRAWFLHGTYG